MPHPHIRYELDGVVARIVLDDPATRNGLTEDMVMALKAALEKASDEARAVLLTGAGPGFCSGANLSSSHGLLQGGAAAEAPDLGALLDRSFNPLVRTIRDLPIPFVTAIHGAAAGFGVSLAVAGDLVVMAESAYMSCAFCHIGLVPDGGASWLLAHAAGRTRAMRMMLLGERIDAATAHAWGLASHVVPDAELEAASLNMAHRLAQGPHALGLIRQLGWRGLDGDFEDALSAERAAQAQAGRSDDFREGIQAFLDKRAPKFTGR